MLLGARCLQFIEIYPGNEITGRAILIKEQD
jgi:hypothetical protein